MNDKSITTSVNNPVETPYIDPSQPGAFLVPSPFPQNELITVHIGAVQPNSDDFPNVIRTFHVQAHRITDSNDSRSSVNQPANCEPERSQSDDELHQKSTDSHKSDENKRRKQRLLLFVGLTVLLISITIIIVIAVPLSLRKPRTDRFSKIKAVVQSISSKNDLKNSSSPQSRALHWLVYEDGLNVSDTDAVWLRQRYTMAVLYYSTGGETWTNSLHFLESIHECLWHNLSLTVEKFGFPLQVGVSCLLSDTFITTIFLQWNNLTGTIPSEMGFISFMKHLIISFGNIGGSIPSTLEMLTTLNYLELRKIGLSGKFPKIIAPTLTDLVLSHNRLVGSVPSLLHLSHLKNFDVTNNSLSGSIPSLPLSLTDIDLSSNRFKGQMPSFMNELNGLKTLLLHRNSFTGTLPSFKFFSNLNILSVNRNSFTGAISSHIWSLPQLILLGLGSNKFEGNLTGIGASSSLEGLSIDKNHLSGSIPSDIGRLTALRFLAMEGNNLSGTIPNDVGFLTNIIYLSFGDNLFTGTIPSLKNFSSLAYISFAGCQFNGTLNDVCSMAGPPFIVADCKGGQFCPQGCCKICCDTDIFRATCDAGSQYFDPLYIAYSLFDPINKNMSWGLV